MKSDLLGTETMGILNLNLIYYFSFVLAIKWFLKGNDTCGFISDIQAGHSHFLKAWSLDHQHQHQLITCYKCRFSRLPQIYQKLQERRPQSVLPSLLGESDASKFENHWMKQSNEQIQHIKGEEVLMKVESAEKKQGALFLVYPQGRMYLFFLTYSEGAQIILALSSL